MKHILITLIVFGFHLTTFGQEFELTEVDEDYYAWLTFLSQGPIDWFEQDENEIEGNAYRLCITTSGIYNNLYIEEVTFGEEGCCKKVKNKKELDLYKLFEKFQFHGEIAGVEFKKWIDFNTFQIDLMGEIFLVDIVPDSNVIIIELE